MVGTGRFELPNALVLANERPLASFLFARVRCAPARHIGVLAVGNSS